MLMIRVTKRTPVFSARAPPNSHREDHGSREVLRRLGRRGRQHASRIHGRLHAVARSRAVRQRCASVLARFSAMASILRGMSRMPQSDAHSLSRPPEQTSPSTCLPAATPPNLSARRVGCSSTGRRSTRARSIRTPRYPRRTSKPRSYEIQRGQGAGIPGGDPRRRVREPLPQTRPTPGSARIYRRARGVLLKGELMEGWSKVAEEDKTMKTAFSAMKSAPVAPDPALRGCSRHHRLFSNRSPSPTAPSRTFTNPRKTGSSSTSWRRPSSRRRCLTLRRGSCPP